LSQNEARGVVYSRDAEHFVSKFPGANKHITEQEGLRKHSVYKRIYEDGESCWKGVGLWGKFTIIPPLPYYPLSTSNIKFAMQDIILPLRYTMKLHTHTLLQYFINSTKSYYCGPETSKGRVVLFIRNRAVLLPTNIITISIFSIQRVFHSLFLIGLLQNASSCRFFPSIYSFSTLRVYLYTGWY
jgi:hypothetical protein